MNQHGEESKINCLGHQSIARIGNIMAFDCIYASVFSYLARRRHAFTLQSLSHLFKLPCIQSSILRAYLGKQVA
jgi:hypothetical protein